MDLSRVADGLLGTKIQHLRHKGLYNIVRSETHTEPLIATIFWQTFVASPAFSRALTEAGASPVAITRGESFVVPHSGRYDLVVFDPFFKGEPSGVASVHVDHDDLKEGWYMSMQRRLRRSSLTPLVLDNFLTRNGLEVALEAGMEASFGLIVASTPELIFTAPVPHSLVFVPQQPMPMCTDACVQNLSTVGVIATDARGREGVTTALHALKGHSSVGVDDNGKCCKGEVVSTDPISDSCFVEVPSLEAHGRREIRGPLSGVTPRIGETVSFEGMTSGPVTTKVTGWSPELPSVFQGSQLKVLTQPATQQGDSGAALLDGDGRILGFAFYRTGYEALIEFAAWIWAELVFMAHNLRGYARLPGLI